MRYVGGRRKIVYSAVYVGNVRTLDYVYFNIRFLHRRNV